MANTSGKPNWLETRQKIKNWEAPELLGLLKDLFKLSPDNQNFLVARLLTDKKDGIVVDAVRIKPYRERIESALFKKPGWPREKFNLADARRAIREYRKATSDPFGSLFLMIYYVETGTNFCRKFGQDMSLIDSISAVMGEIQATCTGKRRGKELYLQFRHRLIGLREKSQGIRYGYGNHVAKVIEDLEGRWSSEKE